MQKEKFKAYKYWLQDLQKLFNENIREREKGVVAYCM
ncbi:hypothetical protein [Chryseobacterium sp. JUb7]